MTESNDLGLMLNSRHDMNNFIGAISGSLSLLSTLSLNDKQKVLVHNALSATHHLHRALESQQFHSERELKPTADASSNFAEQQNSNSLFFAAIEMTRMPMVVTDPRQVDNPIVFANQAFLNTTGYNADEVIGRNCRFLQGKNTDAETTAAIARAIRERTDLAIEILNYRKDGSEFWNALFLSPIFSHSGELLYFFGSQLDVTRRKEAEVALRKSQKMEAVGQLTGGIAHDFNNLLQIILGNLQLARNSHEPERRDNYLQLVQQAAGKARVLTQQLLAFSRKQALETRVITLDRVITELHSILISTLGAKIELDLSLDTANTNIDIDTVQLEVALINLLVNARDALEQGGKVSISTMLEDVKRPGARQDSPAPGHYVKLVVKDNGVGMPGEVLAHATEPFFTTKDVGQGTGLGLAQVYGFTKQSKGYFQIDSKVNEGTAITMYFPVTKDSHPTIDEATTGKKPKGKGEKILVVEDNDEVRELAQIILTESGYEIITAANAHDAIKLLDANYSTLSLIFTDIIMPGSMNGITLAKNVRKEFPSLPILVTTGFADDTHGHSRSSEFEMLYKPYLPDELTAKIQSMLNRKMDHGN